MAAKFINASEEREVFFVMFRKIACGRVLLSCRMKKFLLYRTSLDLGRLIVWRRCMMGTFEVFSLMNSFGMFVIAVLEFKHKDNDS